MKSLTFFMSLCVLLAVARAESEVAVQDKAKSLSAENLKTIAMIFHNYHPANKHFPLPASRGPDGKPLLSWRVLILPYIDAALYRQFHLDEPWDSTHNRTLIEKMPDIYKLPSSKNKEPGRTNYLLPVGHGAAFTMDKPTIFADIKDGTSNTIMVVEADDQHAAIWTKPEDWPFDPKKPSKGLGRFFDDGFHAAFFDGSVSLLSGNTSATKLRSLFTRAGGEKVER